MKASGSIIDHDGYIMNKTRSQVSRKPASRMYACQREARVRQTRMWACSRRRRTGSPSRWSLRVGSRWRPHLQMRSRSPHGHGRSWTAMEGGDVRRYGEMAAAPADEVPISTRSWKVMDGHGRGRCAEIRGGGGCTRRRRSRWRWGRRGSGGTCVSTSTDERPVHVTVVHRAPRASEAQRVQPRVVNARSLRGIGGSKG